MGEQEGADTKKDLSMALSNVMFSHCGQKEFSVDQLDGTFTRLYERSRMNADLTNNNILGNMSLADLNGRQSKNMSRVMLFPNPNITPVETEEDSFLKNYNEGDEIIRKPWQKTVNTNRFSKSHDKALAIYTSQSRKVGTDKEQSTFDALLFSNKGSDQVSLLDSKMN